MSYATIHVINNRATPEKIMKYKTAITLHKIYNSERMSYEWQQLFLNQNFNNRYSKANFLDLSRYKFGKNLIKNRFNIINNMIPYDWLNMNLTSYKLKCKSQFLSQ